MKTLREIKDEHAKELGFTDFEEMFSEALHTGVDYCVDAIATKYANQKLDEAKHLVSLQETKEYTTPEIDKGFEQGITAAMESIISLRNNI